LIEIQQAVTRLASGIEDKETFRITLEKRFTQTRTQDIIEAAAANIKRKVDLSNPDNIILIEVVGRSTGLSLIKPDKILAVMKEKVL
jgi:tRNA acetyltransferase TAN1